jgi:translation initiation factor IF-2
MAKRWLIGGLAVGVGALAVAPEARTWLRRRLGLEAEDRRWFEEDGAEAPEYEGDEPLDTREARFSLRARLSEDAPSEAEAPVAVDPEPSAFEQMDDATTDELEGTPVGELDSSPMVAPEQAEPAAEPEPPAAWAAPEPVAEPESPAPWVAPEPAAGSQLAASESLPALTPEADAPKSPGEDTDEVGPLPGANSWETPAEEPLPPPTELRPPPPPPSRPFSSEGASFRSAIDAARERVHGAAREATPDEGDTEPIDKDA